MPPALAEDPYDRRCLLVSDKGNNQTYQPIHKEDGKPFVAEDALLPAGFVGADGKWHPGHVDADGALVTSGGGGGTGGNKANNAGPPGTNNLGTLPAVATAAAPSYTEGNQVALSTDLAGKLRTDSTGGSGGASAIDEEVFAEGVTTFTPGGGVHDDTLAALAAGKLAVQRLTPRRAGHVNLRWADGTEIGTVATPIQTGSPDGAHAAIGATTDLDTATTAIGLLKKIKALLLGTLTAVVTGIVSVVQSTSPWVVGDGGGSLTVDATSLPLPTGASTEATLALIKAKTDNIDVALSTRTKPSDTQLVSAATLPLPSGAATEATLALVKAKTDNLDVLLSTRTKPADTQLVSAATLPLPAGAATEATLALVKAKTDNLDVLLSTRTKPSDTQAVSAASLPLPTGASTEATLATRLSESDFDTKVGSLTETAPASDTASSGLNGRLQRIAQRLTSLIAQLPAALTGSGNFKVALVETTVTQPVSAAALPLPAGAATEATLALVKAKTDNLDVALSTRATEATLALIKAKTDNIDVALSTRTKPSDQQHVIVDSSALPSGAATEATLGTRLSESDFDTKIGSLTETAPATDTASSGLNGRLQRIAQRLSSLIAQFPAALVGGRFDVNIGSSSATVPVSGTVAVSQPVAVTVANGADVALGAITDPEVAFGDGSAIAIAKHTRTMARSTRNVLAAGLMSLGQQLPGRLVGGRLNVSLGAAPATVRVRPEPNTVWDAGPVNQEIVLFDSRPRTVTQITPDQINTLYKGVMIWLRVTAAPVSPTGFLRISLQARDPVNLTTYLGLNAKTALVPISAAGGFAWMFYPGSAGDVFVANFSGIKDVISYPLPRVWRVVVVHSVPGESYTYSLSATLMR